MTLVPGCSPTVDIWLCSPLQLAKLYVRTITLADVDIEVSDEVTCLGIVLDSILTLAANVKKRTCRESFLSTVTTACCSPHSADAAKTLVHALITVRIDYCNSVLYGVTHHYQSASTSVSYQRGCTPHHWQAQVRPHHPPTP